MQKKQEESKKSLQDAPSVQDEQKSRRMEKTQLQQEQNMARDELILAEVLNVP